MRCADRCLPITGVAEQPIASDSEELLGDSDTIIAFEDHAALECECSTLSGRCAYSYCGTDAMFKAVKGGTLVDKADHFLRHMGDTGEITTVARSELPLVAPRLSSVS